MKIPDYMLDEPDDIEDGDVEDFRDFEEEALIRREMEIDNFNTPSGKWAPADFIYDPLSKGGFE